MFDKVYHATHPDMMDGAANQQLRDRYLVQNLFTPGKVTLSYSHNERFVIGGAVPGAGTLRLPDQTEPASAAGKPFLERRELGIVNIGAPGTVTLDGTSYALGNKEALYAPMGTAEVLFSGEGARFYLASLPAHRVLPARRITVAEANPLERGSLETSNHRTIYQLVIPGVADSCQLLMGLTVLQPGSVWNTMPAHTHERRMEIYTYFNIPEGQAVFHMMGEGQQTRHIVMQNEQAVISPSWSIHAGAGTSNYTFIWAMGGENQTFDDMDHIAIGDLR